MPDYILTLSDLEESPDRQSAPISSPNEIQDPHPRHPPLPPGSICETCWDQPATQILPAPWGGEMGICVGCEKSLEKDGAEERALTRHDMPGSRVTMTPAEVQTFAERLLADVSCPVGMTCRYSSDGQTWHDHITDCTNGVRYVRTMYLPVPPYHDPMIVTFCS